MFVRLGLTAVAIVAAGGFLAAAGPELEPLVAASEPGVPGKFGWHFVVGFAMVVGWAFGAAVEQLWRNQGKDKDVDEVAFDFFMEVLPRLIGGALVCIAIVGVSFAFEAIGVGFGADT